MSDKLREELGFEIKEIEETKEEANNYRVFFANGTDRKANLEEVVLWSALLAAREEIEKLRLALQRRGKSDLPAIAKLCNERDKLKQALTKAEAERERAEEHCRNHHLELCETCMATESELIALRARLSALEEGYEKAIVEALDQTADPFQVLLKIQRILQAALSKLNAGKCETCEETGMVLDKSGFRDELCPDCHGTGEKPEDKS